MASQRDTADAMAHKGRQLDLDLAKGYHRAAPKVPSVDGRVAALEDLVLYLDVLVCAKCSLTESERAGLLSRRAAVQRKPLSKTYRDAVEADRVADAK